MLSLVSHLTQSWFEEMKGKEEEMKRFEEMEVYEYVTKEQAFSDSEGVIIDVRWVVVNKGTSEEPNVRCRLVGREFADKGIKTTFSQALRH